MDIADIIEKERAYLSSVEDFQNDVESKLSEMKDAICEKIDELMASKCDKAASIAASIREHQ